MILSVSLFTGTVMLICDDAVDDGWSAVQCSCQMHTSLFGTANVWQFQFGNSCCQKPLVLDARCVRY